jgi:hypothetical protein
MLSFRLHRKTDLVLHCFLQQAASLCHSRCRSGRNVGRATVARLSALVPNDATE